MFYIKLHLFLRLELQFFTGREVLNINICLYYYTGVHTCGAWGSVPEWVWNRGRAKGTSRLMQHNINTNITIWGVLLQHLVLSGCCWWGNFSFSANWVNYELPGKSTCSHILIQAISIYLDLAFAAPQSQGRRFLPVHPDTQPKCSCRTFHTLALTPREVKIKLASLTEVSWWCDCSHSDSSAALALVWLWEQLPTFCLLFHRAKQRARFTFNARSSITQSKFKSTSVRMKAKC